MESKMNTNLATKTTSSAAQPAYAPDVIEQTDEQIDTIQPKKYRVMLHNDDYTPMDFVVHILVRFFRKNKQEAIDIMLRVHNQGQATCGIYPYQVAEMKVSQVMDLARAEEHPLYCNMTEDE